MFDDLKVLQAAIDEHETLLAKLEDDADADVALVRKEVKNSLSKLTQAMERKAKEAHERLGGIITQNAKVLANLFVYGKNVESMPAGVELDVEGMDLYKTITAPTGLPGRLSEKTKKIIAILIYGYRNDIPITSDALSKAVGTFAMTTIRRDILPRHNFTVENVMSKEKPIKSLGYKMRQIQV